MNQFGNVKIKIEYFLYKIYQLVIHFNIISVADFNPQDGLCSSEEWTKSTYFTGLQVDCKKLTENTGFPSKRV